MIDFILGAIALSCVVAAMFFGRYWRDTRDPLFLFFACSFLLEAVNRTLLAFLGSWTEGRPALYLVRLLAYLIIVMGVIHKNRPLPPDSR